MLAHGLTNPNIYDGVRMRPDGTLDFTRIEQILAMREEAGIGPGVPLYTMNSAAEPVDRPLTDGEKAHRIRMVREIMAWGKRRGYPDVYWTGHDEAWGDQLASQRDSFQAIHDGGGKVFVTCFDFFALVGDVLHRPVMHIDVSSALEHFAMQQRLGADESLRRNAEFAPIVSFEHHMNRAKYRRSIDGVPRLGRKIFTCTTMRLPLPQWQRRQEGLGLWRMGFDGVMTRMFAYTKGDRVKQAMHRGMIFRTDGGVLDTLYWEGFREGVDDVRYLTTLLATLNGALGRCPDEPLIAETHEWLKDLDVARGDLDASRREMTRRIIALQDLGHKDLTPEQILAGIDVDRIEIAPLHESWRFKLVQLDQATLMGPNPSSRGRGPARQMVRSGDR